MIPRPLWPLLGLYTGFEDYGQRRSYLDLVHGCASDHAGDSNAIFELDYPDSVGCHLLELCWRNMNDSVRQQLSLRGHFDPFELVREAAVAQRSRREVKFSAFPAFSAHQSAFTHPLAELLNRELLLRFGHFHALLKMCTAAVAPEPPTL